MFNALEAPNEEFHHDELQATRQEFLGNYTCVNPDNLSYLIDVSIVASYDYFYNRLAGQSIIPIFLFFLVHIEKKHAIPHPDKCSL